MKASRVLAWLAFALALSGCAKAVPVEWSSACPCLYGRPAPQEYFMRCDG